MDTERKALDIYPPYWSWGKSEWTDYLMELWQPYFDGGPADLDCVEISDSAQPGDLPRRAMRFRLLFSSLGMDYIKSDIRINPAIWKGTGD